MKICLYCMVVFGAFLCATSIVFNWLLFDYRASVITFGGLIALIGVFIAYESIDRFGEDDGFEDYIDEDE